MKKGRGWILIYPLTILFVLIGAHWLSRSVSTFTEALPIQREHCIIVDPGHGGVDGGATSCTGMMESRYNLEIALRLDDLLHLLGFNTILTRNQDISIYSSGDTIAQKKISDLKERVRIANETENALVLSIHQNHFTDPRYSGAQVFYAASDTSDELAQTLQASFQSILDPHNYRQAKRSSGVYLMEHIQCPGILIECGFLSNPREETLLRSAAYQKKLCAVIGATASSFLSNT